MKFDATTDLADLRALPELAQRAESLGFDALWAPETGHNPFLGLALAGHATERLEVGTSIAVAFARSPTATAYAAWDLQDLTGGRFILGLGPQIKAHITRRFGMTWDSPGPRMREYIEGMRAVWHTFQTGDKLNYRGQHYKLTFMNPLFQPKAIAAPDIPVYIAAVGPYMCKLAGELCQGVHVHSFHTVRYLQEVMLPRIQVGLEEARRTREDITLSCAIFAATNEQEKIHAKTAIAFYATTPAYRGVLELHGWGDLQEELGLMARRGHWEAMHTRISDEVLDAFGVVAGPADLGPAIRKRYEGLLDRISLYLPFIPGERDDFWADIARTLTAS